MFGDFKHFSLLFPSCYLPFLFTLSSCPLSFDKFCTISVAFSVFLVLCYMSCSFLLLCPFSNPSFLSSFLFPPSYLPTVKDRKL
jgi:hypothetical protein